MANVKRLVRTIYSVRLQATIMAGKQWQALDHETLNEYLSIQQDAVLNTGEVPSTAYLSIGNGGLEYTPGADGVNYPRYLQHSPADTTAFKPKPFVLRTIDNDLSAAQRERFALRRRETHDGIEYFAYYLMRLDLSNLTFAMEHVVTVDGVATTYTFNPSTENMEPTPIDVSTDGAITTASDYLMVTGNLPVEFTQDDVTEYLNAMEIIYGDSYHGFISEFQIVAGVDRVISTTTGDATPISFNEVIGAVVMTHFVNNVPLDSLSNGYRFTIKMGNGEPLLATEDYTSAVVYSNV